MQGSRIILETPMPKRIDIIMDEYIDKALIDYTKRYGEQGSSQWFTDVVAGFTRIQKRLGSERYTQIKECFSEAFNVQEREGKLEGHKEWIEILLEEYYDPMYDYQIKKSDTPIVFSGDEASVLAYIEDHH
jgi:tRNA 2-selenouridine synthase